MNSCKKHPNYKGKKLPKYECEVCLSIYFAVNNKQRKPLALPTKVLKDKSKYDRKRDKKIEE